MIINITQEQKEAIERMGLMVVQVKLLIQKVRTVQKKIQQKAQMVRKNLLEAIENMVRGLKKLLSPIREKKSNDTILALEPRKRYKAIKLLKLYYKAYFSRKGPYHCRNKC